MQWNPLADVCACNYRLDHTTFRTCQCSSAAAIDLRTRSERCVHKQIPKYLLQRINFHLLFPRIKHILTAKYEKKIIKS